MSALQTFMFTASLYIVYSEVKLHVQNAADTVLGHGAANALLSLWPAALCDTQAPKDADFDRIVAQVASASRGTAFVFNCQMGRGRTTTGMIIASLAILQQSGAVAAAAHGGAEPGGAEPEGTPAWLLDSITQARARQVHIRCWQLAVQGRPPASEMPYVRQIRMATSDIVRIELKFYKVAWLCRQ